MDLALTLDVGFVLAFAAVFIELRSQRRRDQEQARREQERGRIEIYQRLELASNELHRFEADHPDLIRPLYTGEGAPTDPAVSLAYRNYVSQLLNLFELQIELYGRGLVDGRILATWGRWFTEVGRAPGFRAVWEDELGEHYSPRLGTIIEHVMRTDGPIDLLDLVATPGD